jgi:glyoxylase-like metal-dependent hydrolase (beta-lactamase superfamily II)
MRLSPDVELLVVGYPGKSPTHGGLGWSTIGLAYVGDQILLIDSGPFGARGLLRQELAQRALTPADVTAVVLTHAHHDHAVNWPMFPNARVFISEAEIKWAQTVADGTTPVAEFYARELATRPNTEFVDGTAEILPGVEVEPVPGHTPGSMMVTAAYGSQRFIFVGDAAKNRAELEGGRGETVVDTDASADSIALIWRRWRSAIGAVVVPGHDLPMTLSQDGSCRLIGTRSARITALLGRHLTDRTDFDLSDRDQ